jgi:NADH-quinone oxidoreductase subunit F
MSRNISSLSGREGKELDDPLWDRLQAAAARTGTPSEAELTEIADHYLIGEAITYGTSSFYDFLKKENEGKKAYVCNGSACLVAGTQEHVHHELAKHFKAEEIGHMCCLGRCHENSAFHVGGLNYSGTSAERIGEILKEAPKGVSSSAILKHSGMDHHHVGTTMAEPILTAPMPSLEEFYALWEQVLKGDSADVLNELKIATVRGRGGAGFPMGFKWESARNTPGDHKYIVCNADEGDPAAYSDRYLLEQRPHLVLLGMMIGGYVTGATSGVLYIRAEYPEAVEVVKEAVAELEAKGWIGKNIKGSGFDFRFRVIKAAGA